MQNTLHDAEICAVCGHTLLEHWSPYVNGVPYCCRVKPCSCAAFVHRSRATRI